MTATPDLPRSHITEFDGLRGAAVLLVLAEHFTFNEWVRGWAPGAIGVRTFFVLSGFLITGILLSDRERFDAATVARRFFRNRALRLLPPFAVAVALAALLGVADMRADWLWHASYLSNVEVVLERRWTGAGHFWTLAVEQQFYLLWFPVVVLLPRRWLPLVMVALVLAAPAFRGLIVAGKTEFLNVLLPAQWDALVLGALLALVQRAGPGRAATGVVGHPAVMWLALAAVVLASAPLPVAKPLWLVWVVQPALISFAALSLIAAASLGGNRLWLLRLAWLVALGRISYGVYVFHYFVPQVLNRYVPFVAGLTEGPEKLLRLAIWVSVSILVAAASWQWLEKPALRRKAGVVWRQGAVPATPQTNDPMPAKAVI